MDVNYFLFIWLKETYFLLYVDVKYCPNSQAIGRLCIWNKMVITACVYIRKCSITYF